LLLTTLRARPAHPEQPEDTDAAEEAADRRTDR
jgi:hypothetical protein